MYYINKEIKFNNQIKASEEIGIANETLCRILKGKQGCSKLVAYCITKHYDSNAEILDYFEYKGE